VRWECRYSPSEMLYLDLTPTDVRQFLHHSPHHPEITSFEDVLAGKIDADVRNLFGVQTLEELKAAVRQQLTSPSKVETKEEARIRRRQENKKARG
jgi:hypothetical protein